MYNKINFFYIFKYILNLKHYTMANVLWLQGGACSGNTMSFLNAEEPTVAELIIDFGLNILWHPTTGLQI